MCVYSLLSHVFVVVVGWLLSLVFGLPVSLFIQSLAARNPEFLLRLFVFVFALVFVFGTCLYSAVPT